MNIELEAFQRLILERERLRSALSSLCIELDDFLLEYDKLQEQHHDIGFPWLRSNCTEEAKKLLETIK